MKKNLMAIPFGLALIAAVSMGALAQAPTQPLPVKAVTLFSSGVAYTERSGDVTGNATLPLVFRTAQINDILKSLVQIDPDGKVLPATYAAKDPIGRTLSSFAIDVSANMSQDEILAKLRGVKVTVETSNKGTITGQIIGVEKRLVNGEDKKQTTEIFLNLIGETGLTSVRIDGDKNVKILDERLNKELKDALVLLASGSDDQRRQVTLHFGGTGKRHVRVGYVTEAPLWKMSYRLSMPDKNADPNGKPFMQGWALVENTSEEDWENVTLSLVSGRPVSFIEDLYQPLYVPRPVVQPTIVASPFPQTHGGSMEARDKAVADLNLNETLARRKDMPADKARTLFSMGTTGGNDAFGTGGLGGGGGRMAGRGAVAGAPLSSADFANIQSQASGEATGELFQYKVSTPVNLPRQQAAMIPVISQSITAEKVSLYNADSDAKFPLNAIRITNNTGQHLKSGPVTIFDEGVYAGDARMDDISPFDNRLVSYAVDLAVEGSRQNTNNVYTDTAYQLRAGVLTITRKYRIETTYVLKSRGDKSRVVLVEHPFNPSFKLLEPAKATETTSSLYRFKVDVAAGKSETLKVVVESPISETFAVLNGDLNMLTVYATRKTISQKMRDVLTEVVTRRRKVQDLQNQAAALDAEVNSINADQDRIRKNMAALDKASALYKRYVTELDNQENRLQTIRTDAANLRNQAAAAERDLRAFIDGINISESI